MAKVDDDDEPVEWERFKAAIPRVGFVSLEDIVATLASKRWSKKRVHRVYAELVAADELIVRVNGAVGLNNAMNRESTS